MTSKISGLLALTLLRVIFFAHATIPFYSVISSLDVSWKTKFVPSLLMFCWWYDWLFKVVVMGLTRVLLDLSMLRPVFCASILQFICRLEVFKLAKDCLLHTFSWCYHKSKTLDDCLNFSLTRLSTFDLMQEKETAMVSNRFIYLVWDLIILSFLSIVWSLFLAKGEGPVKEVNTHWIWGGQVADKIS